MSFFRAGDPANFLAAPAPDVFQAAPAPGFFSSGSGSGSKELKTPGSDRLRLPCPEKKGRKKRETFLLLFNIGPYDGQKSQQ